MDARIFAMASFREATPDALKYYRQACVDGAINGRSFHSCHFGTLARGHGMSFEGQSDDQIFQAVAKFAQGHHIDLHQYGPRTPIEEFCMNISFGDTVKTSPRVALLAEWLDAELARHDRRMRKFRIQGQPADPPQLVTA